MPLPVLPMIAVISPGLAARLIPRSTGAAAPGITELHIGQLEIARVPRRCAPGWPAGRRSGSVSRTSTMRSAQASARGTIRNMNVAIMTEIRICIR